eukprot:gene6536-4896_t
MAPLRWLCACCDAVVRRTIAPTDSDAERARKRQIVTVAMVGLPISVLQVARTWENFAAFTVGNLLCAITNALLVAGPLVTRRLPLGAVELGLCTFAAGSLLIDLGSAAVPGALRLWALVVLVLDFCLVLRVRARTAWGIVGATCLWLAVLQTELAWRWGLFDTSFATARPYDQRTTYTDCAEPPCAAGAGHAGSSLAAYLVAVDNAGHVTTRLARYQTSAARAVLDGKPGGALPPQLRSALLQLVDNLGP